MLEDNLRERISMTLYICKVAEVDRLQDRRIHMKQMVLIGTSPGHSLMAGGKLAPAYNSASVLLDTGPKYGSMKQFWEQEHALF